MSLLAALPELRARPLPRRAVAEGAAAGLAAVGWGLWLAHASGGRAGLALVPALLSLVPALLLVARRIRPLAAVVLLAPGAVALALQPLSITGWQGLDDAATWGYAGLLALVVAGCATTAHRRRWVAVAVVAVGLQQLAQGWWSWYGGGLRSAAMVGTFFWHNPFAAFVLAAALMALVLSLTSTRRGWPWSVAAGLLGSGVVLSGSRATLALLVLAFAVVLVVVVRSRTGLVRWGVAAVGVPVAAWALALPLTGADAVGGSLAARGLDTSVSTSIRADYYRAALDLWQRHVWSGAGFGSYDSAGQHLMPLDAPATSLVHNGWLQVGVDGGLVWLLPVLVVTVAPLLAAALAVLDLRRRGRDADRVLLAGAGLAVIALWAHAMVDFDWSYPALLGMYAVLGGLVAGRWLRRPATDATGPDVVRRRRVGPLAAVVALVAVLLGVAAGVAAAQQAPLRDLGPWGSLLSHVPGVSWAVADLPTRNGDLRTLALGPADAGVLDPVIARTARAAADDPVLAQARAQALVRLGRVAAGEALSQAAYPADPRPSVVLARAAVLVSEGRPDAARALVRDALLRAGDPDLPGVAGLQAWLEESARSADGTSGGGSSSPSPGSPGGLGAVGGTTGADEEGGA